MRPDDRVLPVHRRDAGTVLGVLASVVALVAGAAPAEGQWVEAPGQGWTQVTLHHQDTRSEYGEDGEVRDFFARGHAVTTSLFVTSAVGLVPGADAWVQASFHHLRFDDVAADREQTGLADLRLWARIGPELLGLDAPLPLAVRGGVKLPGTDFPVDAEVIPLNEGQRDWELLLELGHSLWPTPAYLQGWVGYRWRERNEEVLRDPGDELFYYAAAGGELGRLDWKLASQGTFGRAPVIEGVRVPSEERELVEIVPRLGYRWAPATVQAGVRIPVDGRNHPKGVVYTVGAFFDWTLF